MFLVTANLGQMYKQENDILDKLKWTTFLQLVFKTHLRRKVGHHIFDGIGVFVMEKRHLQEKEHKLAIEITA